MDRAAQRTLQEQGGLWIVACFRAVKGPLLSANEPEWAHGKRAIVEADRAMTGAEFVEQERGYYGRERLDEVSQ